MQSGNFNLWVFGDAHVGTDLKKGRESLSDALLTSERGMYRKFKRLSQGCIGVALWAELVRWLGFGACTGMAMTGVIPGSAQFSGRPAVQKAVTGSESAE